MQTADISKDKSTVCSQNLFSVSTVFTHTLRSLSWDRSKSSPLQRVIHGDADALAKKCAKITQAHIRKTSYHSIKLHLQQLFQSVYGHELETKLSQKLWKQERAKIRDWPRIKAVVEFRLCFGHDYLGTHLHRIAIRPDPYCMLCSLREPTDRNRLGQCTALSNL